MITLKHIDVLPIARINVVIYAIIGTVIGVFVFLFAGIFSRVIGVAGRGVVLYLRITSLIIIPIVFSIAGFVIAAVGAWFYNMIADRVGGIRLSLTKDRLKEIDTVSAAKVYAIGGAIAGFVFGVIFAIAGAAVGRIGVLRIAGIIIFPAVFGVIFFVIAAIGAIIYNFIASKIGGVVLKFRGRELRRIGAMSYAKIEGIAGAIVGFVEGAIYSVSSLSSVAATMIPGLAQRLGVLSIVVYPIYYLVLSFVFALIGAWLYNVAAPKVGGIKVTLKK